MYNYAKDTLIIIPKDKLKSKGMAGRAMDHRIQDQAFNTPTLGGFLKWGCPNSWMDYDGKSKQKMDDWGVPLFQKTTTYNIYTYYYIVYYIYIVDT